LISSSRGLSSDDVHGAPCDGRLRDCQMRLWRGARGSRWPTYREFERAGLKRLRDMVTRQGGARRWAKEMGVRHVEHRPGYTPKWTEERIRDDLRNYLGGHVQWPSRQQFEHDGRTALRNAVNRTGGPARWAAEFDLSLSSRRSGLRRGWTPEAIERELGRLVGKNTTWPPRRQFERAGLASMLTAIYRFEGAEYWATRMHLQRRPRFSKPRKATWTSERIRADLAEFCIGRATWPTEREFIDAGRQSLYRAASRSGGVAVWAAELGLARGRKRRNN